MSWLSRLRGKPEARASIENPSVPLSAANAAELLGWNWGTSAAGVTVTLETALGVPAVWAAVNFLSATIAGLPANVYRKTDKGREKIKGGLQDILHDAVNAEMSSFDWRKYTFEQYLTGGRGLSYIEFAGNSKVRDIWPLDPQKTVIRRGQNGARVYEYSAGGRKIVYEAAEIIDLCYMGKPDLLGHYSPIMTNKDTIGLAIAATNYGSRFFQNGGVPPFAITGPFTTPAGAQRASDDLMAAVKSAAKESRLALTLPTGHDIKSLGIDPEKSQLVELKRFIIEEVARIYSLPPAFLQDLTHGTFSNTEQQDLHLVKHTLKRLVEQFEQEINLKLFGRGSNQYFELNMDGLLRGDFASRMSGYATAIQSGVLKPNEGRAMENRADDPAGDRLFIQGAMVPLEDAGKKPEAAPPAPPPEAPKQRSKDDMEVHVHLPKMDVTLPEIRVPDIVARVEMAAQLPPVVNVAAPVIHFTPPPEAKPKRTRTKVTGHDAKGRIKSYEQEEIKE